MKKHEENGVIAQKFDIRDLGSTKKFRQFLLIIDDEIIRFTCSQSMCFLLDNFDVGQTVTVKFTLRTENILYCEHIRLQKPTA